VNRFGVAEFDKIPHFRLPECGCQGSALSTWW